MLRNSSSSSVTVCNLRLFSRKPLKYVVGKRRLHVIETTLPDSVLELELALRERLSRHAGQRIPSKSRVLAFREQKETTFEKPYRILTVAQLKIREIAKTTLMIWVTHNILQILDLGSYMTLPARNWHKFMNAVAEQNVSYLSGVPVGHLAKRFAVKPATLDAAIKHQLERLYEQFLLRGSRKSRSYNSKYDMHSLPARQL